VSEPIIKGLTPSFHLSFLPERRHLASLLAAASQGFSGTVEAMSEHTGIPRGKSSGKVIPHLKYAQAMGLLSSKVPVAGVHELQLTPLGQAVSSEDMQLNETLTQLILHLMLARPVGGAAAWHTLFGRSQMALGRQFSSEAATAFLALQLGNSSSIPGPLFSTYKENASLARTGMLTVEKNMLARGSLPPLPEHFWGYSYCWLHAWEQVAPNDQQLPASQLETLTAFEELTGWTRQQMETFLSWAIDQQILRVDRQTGVPLLMKTASSAQIAAQIYSDML
jgi:hypothetical protein